MVYEFWSSVVSLIQKRGLVTSRWFKRGISDESWFRRGGLVTFMVQNRGSCDDGTKSVSYLWCQNWHHMHRVEKLMHFIHTYFAIKLSLSFVHCCEWYSWINDWLILLYWDMSEMFLIWMIYTLTISMILPLLSFAPLTYFKRSLTLVYFVMMFYTLLEYI